MEESCLVELQAAGVTENVWITVVEQEIHLAVTIQVCHRSCIWDTVETADQERQPQAVPTQYFKTTPVRACPALDCQPDAGRLNRYLF